MYILRVGWCAGAGASGGGASAGAGGGAAAGAGAGGVTCGLGCVRRLKVGSLQLFS